MRDTIELYVTDGFSFFSNPSELRRGEPLAVSYLGGKDVTLTVCGNEYALGVDPVEICNAEADEGYIECRVTVDNVAVPCEGLKHRGGYIYPAGITNKAYVKGLFEKCEKLMRTCEELQAKVDEFAVRETEEDLLNI